MTITVRQFAFVERALLQCADEASDALARWIERPTRIAFDSLERLGLDEATSVLGTSDQPICFCRTDISGGLQGHLILAFDDASGLSLADLLLGQKRGTATDWNDMEESAALETSNIVCCAYLNALARALSASLGGPVELMPAPPQFARDFAESLIQFALMDQIVMSDQVLLARTEFQIDGAPVDWTLLFVPDAKSMETLNLDST